MTTDNPPFLSSILILDKPEGLTSMDVCRRIRRRLVNAGAPKRVKVGHGGTLDPLATGVLVILVGKATKRCNEIMDGPKRYIAAVDLSCFSTTDDREGEQAPVQIDTHPTLEHVRAACEQFTGTIQQTPPIYSAMKVGGKRAYKLARAGETPKMEPRPVTIHSIDIISYDFPIATLDIHCGKGTYIRSLARDLGKALHTGGMLTALRRTAVEPFTIEQAITLEDIPDVLSKEELEGLAVGG